MFDTMTLTKVAAAFCGSLLVFLLALWLAETLYHVGGDSHGGHSEAAYVIEDDTEIVEENVEEVDFETILASANPDKGSKVCLLYTSPSPRDATLSRMPSSA